MKRFEYTDEIVEKITLPFLNECGSNGWRLCHSEPRKDGLLWVVFERELPEETKDN